MSAVRDWLKLWSREVALFAAIAGSLIMLFTDRNQIVLTAVGLIMIGAGWFYLWRTPPESN